MPSFAIGCGHRPERIDAVAAPRATLVAYLLVALVAGGCVSAGTGGSSAPAGSHTFVSERYAFTIQVPPGASPRGSTVDWDATCLCGLANPAWDAAKVDGRTFAIGAVEVDATMDLAQWQAMMVELAPAICTDSAPAAEATLDGEEALTWTASCSDGNAIKLAVLHGGRGYMVLFDSPTSEDWDDRWRAFDTLIGSFRFES
ncbi:MAG TPA: hypothetical protein VF365_06975 [Candidatus Limnocylindria bacterium]